MNNRVLTATGVLLVGILVALLVVSSNKLDRILTTISKPKAETVHCVEGNTCWKFKHESELVLPPFKVGNCEPYKMPEISQAPPPSSIEVPAGAGDEQVVRLLLDYIDRVLEHDQKTKDALVKSYQDYMASCEPKPEKVEALVKTD